MPGAALGHGRGPGSPGSAFCPGAASTVHAQGGSARASSQVPSRSVPSPLLPSGPSGITAVERRRRGPAHTPPGYSAVLCRKQTRLSAAARHTRGRPCARRGVGSVCPSPPAPEQGRWGDACGPCLGRCPATGTALGSGPGLCASSSVSARSCSGDRQLIRRSQPLLRIRTSASERNLLGWRPHFITRWVEMFQALLDKSRQERSLEPSEVEEVTSSLRLSRLSGR